MHKTINTAIENLNDYIVKNKIYKSEEREIILKCIVNLNAHFTIASLLTTIQTTHSISRATIYNSVNLFLKAGLIIRHPFGSSDGEFETIWRSSTHHHRICTHCGMIKEFSDKKIHTPIKNRHFNTFEKSTSCVYIYGTCKKCNKSQTTKKAIRK